MVNFHSSEYSPAKGLVLRLFWSTFKKLPKSISSKNFVNIDSAGSTLHFLLIVQKLFSLSLSLETYFFYRKYFAVTSRSSPWIIWEFFSVFLLNVSIIFRVFSSIFSPSPVLFLITLRNWWKLMFLSSFSFLFFILFRSAKIFLIVSHWIPVWVSFAIPFLYGNFFK